MFRFVAPQVKDQAALIPDRVECLDDLPEPVLDSISVPITDKLHFFIGDKPAAQFKRGITIGGRYKCGDVAVETL